MSGTAEGGRRAKAKNLARDPDFYSKIGAKGGKNGNTGGFAYLAKNDPDKLKALSRKGGTISKRKPSLKSTPVHLEDIAEL